VAYQLSGVQIAYGLMFSKGSASLFNTLTISLHKAEITVLCSWGTIVTVQFIVMLDMSFMLLEQRVLAVLHHKGVFFVSS